MAKLTLWLLGIFFAILSLTYVKESFLASICFFILAVFLTPPLSDLPSTIIKKPISNPLKTIICFLLLLLAFRLTPATTSTPPSTSISSEITPTKSPTTDSPATTTPPTDPNIFFVKRVVDGDTFMITVDNKEVGVRMLGIDTPESVDPRSPIQCFGKEASAKTKELIEGKTIKLEADPTQGDKDKYNRLLRYVYLEDGTSINKKLISDGFAYEYTYSTPYKFQTEFKNAQIEAEKNKSGLWADGACPTAAVKPTKKPVIPTTIQTTNLAPPPAIKTQAGNAWGCDCSKACSRMSSCSEAQYQLNSCGCSARDGDGDGIACDSQCQ